MLASLPALLLLAAAAQAQPAPSAPPQASATPSAPDAGSPHVAPGPAALPALLGSAKLRTQLLHQLIKEVERLDAVALEVRANRAEPWRVTVQKLEKEMAAAKTGQDVLRVLQKLDAAYPNLHCSVQPGPELERALDKPVVPGIRVEAEWLALRQTRWVVSGAEPLANAKGADQPQEGDEITAINGIPMAKWSEAHHALCKHPLREQCDQELFASLQAELLGWTRAQPLTYTLRRASRKWTVTVPMKDPPPRRERDPGRFECGRRPQRYPGFHLVYSGNRACVYQSDADPTVAVLRVVSFRYQPNAPEQTITSLPLEIEKLRPWWQQNARWSQLVVDLVDNGGGQEPWEYYRLLLHEPFQELYAAFKRLPELEDAKHRLTYFNDSAEHEAWFASLAKPDRARPFLPPVPMFCAQPGQSCATGLFQPVEHPFRGRVSVLTNHRCVSSCDGFVWQLKDRLQARLFGHPHAADYAFSRAAIDLYPVEGAPGRFRTETRPQKADSSGTPWLTQVVTIARSTTRDGKGVDGNPLPLDGFVPLRLDNIDTWHQEALQAALESARAEPAPAPTPTRN